MIRSNFHYSFNRIGSVMVSNKCAYLMMW